MADKLVIVESPSKATTIKKYLGKGYTVTASNGHVIDLPKSQLGIDVDNNFEPRYITIRGKGDLIKNLKKLAKGATKIYLATDPDREGEAISWHLANVLDIDENSKCRITFNEITKKAVTQGIKEPRKIDLNLVEAQQARRLLDRIVGYKISPLLWKKVKKGLSAGRVQSVATKLICDREEEIRNFVSEEYWTLDANLLKGRKKINTKFYGKINKKIDLKSGEETDKIVNALNNAQYQVSEIKTSSKKKSPAPPFITSTLQQDAGKKLGFKSQRTMQAAQQLYEGINIKGKGQVGLITYMRTDSLRISDDARKEARTFINETFGSEYLPKTERIYKTKKNAQDAHEAIRPSYVEYTPESIKSSLTGDQYKIYKLIWERFIASQMRDAIYDTVTVSISANDYIFKTSGSTIKKEGFTKVYIENTDEAKQSKLPPLEEGEILNLDFLDRQQHFTQPPARYTEASLIKTFEELGIGRPSTYSPTITTIIARGYVVTDKKSLVPTELGEIVNSLMKENFKDIVDVDFTANMEDDLDKIEEGKLNWHNVISEFYSPFEESLKLAEKNIGEIELKDEESDVVCDKCGKLMVYKRGKFGKFLACPGFPECRNTKTIVKEINVKCPSCNGEVIEKKSKRGKIFYGCTNYPKCDFTSWDKPTNKTCPSCGGVMFEKKGKEIKYYCPACLEKNSKSNTNK